MNTYNLLAQVVPGVHDSIEVSQQDSSIASVEDPTIALENDVKDQSSFLVVTLIIVLSLLLIIFILMYLRVKKHKEQLSDQLDAMKSKSKLLKDKVEKLKETERNLKEITTRLSVVKEVKPDRIEVSPVRIDQAAKESIESQSSQIKDKPVNNTDVEQEVKYGDSFSQNGQELFILERYLYDDSNEKLFKFKISQDLQTASYTLNDGIAKERFLEKLNDSDFKKCIEDVELPFTPKELKVVELGSLEKRGNKWYVIKKLVIKVL